MNVRLRMYKYCYSNLGAIYAKGLYIFSIKTKIWIKRRNKIVKIYAN